MGVEFSYLCFACAGSLIYLHIVKPSENNFMTVTDLRKRAKHHNKKHYSESTYKGKKGGF